MTHTVRLTFETVAEAREFGQYLILDASGYREQAEQVLGQSPETHQVPARFVLLDSQGRQVGREILQEVEWALTGVRGRVELQVSGLGKKERRDVARVVGQIGDFPPVDVMANTLPLGVAENDSIVLDFH